MKIPQGYKQTEIGIIPEDWGVTTIGNIGLIVGGGTPSTAVEAYWNGGIQWFTPAEINESEKYASKSYRTISDLGLRNSSAKLLPKKAILLTTRASIGQSAILLNEATTNQGFQSIVVNSEHDNEFIYYLLKTKVDEMRNLASGSTFLEISNKKLSSISIAIPTIEEQRRIAEVLSDVDGLISALDKKIAKKKLIKQAAMQQLLKNEDIEPVSLDNIVKAGDITLYRGKIISKKDIEMHPGSHPIYSSSVHNNGLMGYYGKFMFDEELISWSVDGGGHFFYRPKHKFSVTNVSGYMRINTNKYDYKYLAYLLQFEHSKKIFDYQTKAHPNVIRTEYELRIPDLDKQKNIAAILSNIDAEIHILQKKRDKYTLIKQGMMQKLLTGQIRLKN